MLWSSRARKNTAMRGVHSISIIGAAVPKSRAYFLGSLPSPPMRALICALLLGSRRTEAGDNLTPICELGGEVVPCWYWEQVKNTAPIEGDFLPPPPPGTSDCKFFGDVVLILDKSGSTQDVEVQSSLRSASSDG